MTTVSLSVVVPALNEEACIASFIERIREQLSSLVPLWEIVVVDDGSTDRTREIVEDYARADPRVKLLSGPHRGKGAAVRQGMLAAQGEWRFMADADLSMPPDNLARFLEATRAEPASRLFIGSREAPGARRMGEPWSRHLIGRVFNWIVRALAVPGVRDTQCGFKLIHASAVERVVRPLTIDGFAGAVAYDLMQMPVQASDSLGEILDAQASPSVWTSFTGALSTTGYLRPLRIAQIKVLFDLADGHYWPVYRGFHAMLIVACVALFTRALRVRTRTDLAAASFALTVLMGLHTFRGTVQEAFPINHFLEVVVCCLFTLNLTQSAGGARVDALAALTLMVAALTLESGLLVWVVAVSAWMAGLRGISRRGLVAMTTLVAGYMYVRFAYLATGAPTLTERSAGFGLSVLDPPELQRRFGQHPMLFYAYNVVASGLSVLVAEPQSGVFVATRAWLRATMLPRDAIPVATSAVTTIVLGWAALTWRRARALRDDHARLMPVFIAVLGANAALSFAYTKDEIMSVAGVFYALAAYASVRLVLQRASSRRAAALATGCLLFALGSGWAVRSAGVHYGLRSQAFKHRNDWSRLPGEWKREGRWPEDAASQRLIMRLYSEAIDRSAPNPRFEPTWAGRVWAE